MHADTNVFSADRKKLSKRNIVFPLRKLQKKQHLILKYDVTKHSTVYRTSKNITVYRKNPAKGAVVQVKVGKRTFKKKITSSSKKVTVPVKNLSYGVKAKINVYYKNKLIGSDKCYYRDDIVYYASEVTTGMTPNQVRYTLGKSYHISNSSYGYTTWYYSGGSVTFKNGRVVRWFFMS